MLMAFVATYTALPLRMLSMNGWLVLLNLWLPTGRLASYFTAIHIVEHLEEYEFWVQYVPFINSWITTL